MSNVVVNELEIKVQSTASGALSSLTKVMNRLDNLQKKMDSFSSKKVVSELGKINSSLGTNATNNIDKLADALKKIPASVKQASDSMKKLPQSTNGISSALSRLPKDINLGFGAIHAVTHAVTGAFRVMVGAIKNAYNAIKGWVTESMDYVETLNLFNVTMGQFAEEATEYAEQVESIMGINIADWMNAQAVFMALGTGFGVASEKAYLVSKNLTQLGYDLSSFYNIKTADAMEKLQAGISGELEPLRRLGFDLSMAKLQEIALANGINQRVESMTQAEKAQLRYIAIMQQSVNAQGDMARTLNAPANQLRILQANAQSAARALGNIFIPALNAILPAAIVALQAIRMVADAIARMFGFSIPEVDYGNAFGGVSSGASDAEDAIDGATGAAKKFKQATLGFDELNVIAPQDSSGGSGASGGGGGGYDFELPEYDFLAEMVKSKIQEMMDKLLEFYDLVQSNVPTTAFDYIRDSWERLKKSFGEFREAWSNLFGEDFLKNLFAQIIADIETDALELAGDIMNGIAGALEIAAGTLNVFGSVGKVIGEALAGQFNIEQFVSETAPTMAEGLGQMLDGAIKLAFSTIDPERIIDAFQAFLTVSLFFTGGPIYATIIEIGQQLAGALIEAFVSKLTGDPEIDLDGWWIGVKNALFEVDFSLLFGGIGDKFARWFADDVNSGVKAQGDLLINNFLRQLDDVWAAVFGDGAESPFGEVEVGSGWLFTEFEETFGPIRDLISEVKQGLSEMGDAFALLGESVTSLVSTVLEPLQPVFDLLKGVLIDVWQEAEPVISPVVEFVSAVLTEMGEHFGSFSAYVGTMLDGVGFVVQGLQETITVFSIDARLAFTAVKLAFLAVANFLNEKINLVKDYFSQFNTFISTTFKDGWETGWTDIKTGFISIIQEMVNEGIGFLNSLITKAEEAINTISGAISSVSGGLIDLGEVDFGRIEEVNWTGIQKKASGGFVNTGELFIANEAGPELVGSIGSRTAVANNDQIVSGIAAGVYSAMSAALADNATSDGNINITVKLDSDVIYRKTEDKKRQRGYNMGMGAFAQ